MASQITAALDSDSCSQTAERRTSRPPTVPEMLYKKFHNSLECCSSRCPQKLPSEFRGRIEQHKQHPIVERNYPLEKVKSCLEFPDRPEPPSLPARLDRAPTAVPVSSSESYYLSPRMA